MKRLRWWLRDADLTTWFVLALLLVSIVILILLLVKSPGAEGCGQIVHDLQLPTLGGVE